MDFTLYKNFAEELVISAGKIVEEGKNSFSVVKQKDLQDVATTVDMASEKFITSGIAEKFPDHSIFSEESPEIDNKSDFRWIIDPLDGTKAYVRGLPLYNVSITLEHKGVPVVAAIYFPPMNDLYIGFAGGGSFRNGKRIKVSEETDLKKSYVGIYFSTKNRPHVNYDEGWSKMRKISESCYRIRAEGSSNIALSWLAHGGMEAYVNLTNPPHHHDLVSGLLIAKEAGALVKEFDDGTFLVANNKYIFESLTGIINS
jgi:myo-inositol-1(or 4)-monophosphatase